MTEQRPSLEPSYFEQLYAGDDDPWKFASSAYEQAKYAATLAAIPRRSITSAFEIGCSIGILTRQLAPLCDRLLAVDVAEAPLEKARMYCRDLPHVAFRRLQIPEQWPSEQFNLILMSEVLYYLSFRDIANVAQRTRNSLSADGAVLLVHWTGETDYPCSGDQAAEAFTKAVADWLPLVMHQRAPEYRIDLLARP